MGVIEQVAQLIAKSMTEEQTCCRAGVNHDSFRTARRRNPDLETAIKASQAPFLDESLDVIAQGQRGWRGRAWILERRHGGQFKRSLSVEVACNRIFLVTKDDLHSRARTQREQFLGPQLGKSPRCLSVRCA